MQDSPLIWIAVVVFVIGKFLLETYRAGKGDAPTSTPRRPSVAPVDPFPRPTVTGTGENLDRIDPMETDEEARQRKFMEALGLPPGTQMPRRVLKRPQPAPRAEAPSVPPPLPGDESPFAPEPSTRPVFREEPRDPFSPFAEDEPPAPPKKRFREHNPQPVAADQRPSPLAEGPLAPEFGQEGGFVHLPPVQSIDSVAPTMQIGDTALPERAERQTASARAKGKLETDYPTLRDFRDSAALRKAFIMQEILGPPLAMREETAK